MDDALWIFCNDLYANFPGHAYEARNDARICHEDVHATGRGGEAAHVWGPVEPLYS
jgi:hypothetical protein